MQNLFNYLAPSINRPTDQPALFCPRCLLYLATSHARACFLTAHTQTLFWLARGPHDAVLIPPRFSLGSVALQGQASKQTPTRQKLKSNPRKKKTPKKKERNSKTSRAPAGIIAYTPVPKSSTFVCEARSVK
jgi:hypothetical protein